MAMDKATMVSEEIVCVAWIPEGGRSRRNHYSTPGRRCRNKIFRDHLCKPCYEHGVSVELLNNKRLYEAFKYANEHGIEPFDGPR